jgi:tripartite-type tricarboxylate transporter receptor subunit TctC
VKQSCPLRLLIIVGMLCRASIVFAQDFPDRPIHLIIPYPAGGTTDIMARALQEPMAKLLGQPLVVENRPGAAAMLGTLQVARAKPDGYTLLFCNNGVSIAPFLQNSTDFDPRSGLSAVSVVSRAPLLLLVNSKVPATSIAGLFAYAKTRSEGLLFASAGPGSLGHLSSELLARRAGLKMIHVPYKGQGPTTQAIMTGEVDVLLTTASSAMNGFIQEGKIRLLGVSSKAPSILAPGAEPIDKVLPGYVVDVWFGILAPKGTPRDVIAKINSALATTLADPQIKEQFIGFGVEASASTPEALDGMIATEVPEWQAIIKAADIKTE